MDPPQLFYPCAAWFQLRGASRGGGKKVPEKTPAVADELNQAVAVEDGAKEVDGGAVAEEDDTAAAKGSVDAKESSPNLSPDL